MWAWAGGKPDFERVQLPRLTSNEYQPGRDLVRCIMEFTMLTQPTLIDVLNVLDLAIKWHPSRNPNEANGNVSILGRKVASYIFVGTWCLRCYTVMMSHIPWLHSLTKHQGIVLLIM